MHVLQTAATDPTVVAVLLLPAEDGSLMYVVADNLACSFAANRLSLDFIVCRHEHKGLFKWYSTKHTEDRGSMVLKCHLNHQLTLGIYFLQAAAAAPLPMMAGILLLLPAEDGYPM
jgi:hypothetical protein